MFIIEREYWLETLLNSRPTSDSVVLSAIICHWVNNASTEHTYLLSYSNLSTITIMVREKLNYVP